MSGNLHLFGLKTEGFHAKFDAIYTTFHNSEKRRKITFNSSNYNLFRYSF